jgi:hypothetical protein
MLDSTEQSPVMKLIAYFGITIHGFSATTPASPKAPTVGALAPASMQSWIPAIPAGMTCFKILVYTDERGAWEG